MGPEELCKYNGLDNQLHNYTLEQLSVDKPFRLLNQKVHDFEAQALNWHRTAQPAIPASDCKVKWKTKLPTMSPRGGYVWQ